MMNRRSFLRNSALGLTAAAAAHAPTSLFANPYGLPVGLQLFTLRDDLQKNMLHLNKLRQLALEKSSSMTSTGRPPQNLRKF